MNKEKLDQLKEILSIPTYFGHEERVRDYIISFGISNGIPVLVDTVGNVYLTKGKLDEGEYYPFVCAHMDSVHSEHIPLIDENRKKIIEEIDIKGSTCLIAKHPDTMVQTGLAADDLAGVFMALSMFEHFDKLKGGFFVKEEFGCDGSFNCAMDFFDNVGYAIQFDSPGFNRYAVTLMGIDLCDDKFNEITKPILEKYSINNFTHDPYTDVYALKEQFDFCCANLPAGYYNWHSTSEYVKINDIEKSLELSPLFIKTLGNKKYKFETKSRGLFGHKKHSNPSDNHDFGSDLDDFLYD
jgi:putative aminopeptidase FrvX